jgi:prevent-host-death family protein
MATDDPIQTITISEFKATCVAVLDRVKRTGRPVLVTRRGEPVARVVPPAPSPRPKSWLGCMAGRVKILSDVVSPASDEDEWEAVRK